MAISAQRIISLVLFLLIGVIMPFVLQVFLSKCESRYPGLVLPILSVLFSVMIVLGSVMYDGNAFSVIIPFILFNIPTVIHLAIYFACREKFSKKKQMDKMSIQDL